MRINWPMNNHQNEEMSEAGRPAGGGARNQGRCDFCRPASHEFSIAKSILQSSQIIAILATIILLLVGSFSSGLPQ